LADVPTVLVHLSDIHFRRGRSGTPYDIDTDLRAQLERDVKAMCDRLEAVHAIIVSGDIGFSGKKEEYEIARVWLDKLCALLGCPTENVWMVPGNHDVDRDVIAKSNNLQLLHSTIRFGSGSLDDRLRVFMYEDREAGALLFRSLQNYNGFAARFSCAVDEAKLYWQHNLELNDGSMLRLHGATSTLVSDESDDDGTNRLVLGTAQTLLGQEDGVENLFICHHPPDWLLDRDNANDRLCNRARIQLFGHKHAARVTRINDSLRLVAGATHPDRAEAQWEPGYNIITLRVEGADSQREMRVDSYLRVWNGRELCFIGELYGARDYRSYLLPLSSWTRPATVTGPPPVEQTGEMEVAPQTSVFQQTGGESTGGQMVNPARRLTYQFMCLPYHVRLEVAQKLSLIQDEDGDIEERQRNEVYFRRAKERRLLERLWEEVERKHGERPSGENPFVGR